MISIYHQPFFTESAERHVGFGWGYGLLHDRPGDHVKKPMVECTCAEILEEVLGQLPSAPRDADAIMAASTGSPFHMPCITSQFMARTGKDRPKVVPDGSTSLAFMGQDTEQADEIVFTVEYSVRCAMTAVCTLLKLDKTPPNVYKGLHSPQVIVDAIWKVHR